MASNVLAVEVRLALRERNPISYDRDRSGRITFEFSSSEADAIAAIQALGFDASSGEPHVLRALFEREGQGV